MEIPELPEKTLKERDKSRRIFPHFDEKEAAIIKEYEALGESLGSDDLFEILKGWLEDLTDEVILENVKLRQSDSVYLSALYEALTFNPFVSFTLDPKSLNLPEGAKSYLSLSTLVSIKKSYLLEALRVYLNTSAALARRFAAPSLQSWRELILLLHEEHLNKKEGAYEAEKMKTFIEKLQKARKDLYVEGCIVLRERKIWGGEE